MLQQDVVENLGLDQGLTVLQQMQAFVYEYNDRELVYEYGMVKLYHYKPKVKKPDSIPVLVVFATVNRPEILDIFPDHSFIRGLLDNGLDVYFLDWGYPAQSDKDVSFSDYVNNYLHHCVRFIQEASGQEKINLCGICQGGLICLCYAALHSYVNKLTLISAPIDFATSDNTVGQLLNKIDIDQLIQLHGTVPGLWLTQFFITLRPFELIGKKYYNFIKHLDDTERTNKFLRIEKWLYDVPNQTARSFKDLATLFYRDNKLVKGELFLSGKKVDLKKINIPVLNVMAEQDEIVPVSASQALKKHIGSTNYKELYYPSGHIGIYVSDKVGKRMPKDIAAWFKISTSKPNKKSSKNLR